MDEGWRPNDLHPEGGRTEARMVFTTGSGAEFTIWSLVDFDTRQHHTRYSRVTPASRCGFVEVRCAAIDATSTRVEVTYTLTALNADGERALAAFGGGAFVAMIEDWQRRLDERAPALRRAQIR